MNFSSPWFKNSWLKSPGLKSSFLKSLGLKGPGLKLGVEMSFNQGNVDGAMKCSFKGLHLLFLTNVPEDTFIQGAMSIPDSRVHNLNSQSTIPSLRSSLVKTIFHAYYFVCNWCVLFMIEPYPCLLFVQGVPL